MAKKSEWGPQRRALREFPWIVVLVGGIGALFALQGWRSVLPEFDLLTTIDGARGFIENGLVPDRGVLSSFASYTPPGAVWLQLPGMLLTGDPRLFHYAGTLALYVGTLMGIYLLARPYLGTECAVVAVLVYGWSELGLWAASSLWQRFPLHFFYVWMVFGTVKWLEKNDARFLALACVSWAAGMYVMMEMAPAIFIIPVVWALYRPALRARPLAVAAILTVVIWLPYLAFQADRNFVDLKSQVLRQHIGGVNYEESWCEPGLARIAWPQDLLRTQSPARSDRQD